MPWTSGYSPRETKRTVSDEDARVELQRIDALKAERMSIRQDTAKRLKAIDLELRARIARLKRLERARNAALDGR